MVSRRATLAAMALALGSCRHEAATQLLLAVGTDIPVGSQLERIEVEVSSVTAPGVIERRTIVVSDAPMPPFTVAMPFSMGVVPQGGDASREVQVVVRGRFASSGLRDRVVGTAITGFLEHEVLLLPMFLEQSCVDVTSCQIGYTCVGGRCRDAHRPASQLRVIDVTEATNPVALLERDAAAEFRDAADARDVAADAPTHLDATSDRPDATADVAALDRPDVATDRAPLVAPDAAPSTPLRMVEPLTATQLVTTTPRLRWVVPDGASSTRARVCRDVAMRSGCRDVAPGGSVVGGRVASVDVTDALNASSTLWWSARAVVGGVEQTAGPWWFATPAESAPTRSPWREWADVDGDGHPDLAALAWPDGAGAATLVVLAGGNGTDAVPLATRALTALDPSDAESITLSVAGDLDADGFVDLAIGHPSQHAVIVVYGAARGRELRVATHTMASTHRAFGASVAPLGDVNRDGFADLLVGAPASDAAGLGGAVVLLGGVGGVDLARGVAVHPPAAYATQAGARIGASVAGLGDLDGDGANELAVGYPDANRVFVYFGGGAATTPVELTGGATTASGFGSALAGVGDVNRDGFGDFVVAGRDARVLLLGSSTARTAPMTRRALETTAAGCAGTPPARVSVTGPGDLDDDGYDDVVIGDDTGCLIAYLGRGGSSVAHAPVLGASHASAAPGFAVTLASLGDFTGDGVGDLATTSRTTARASVLLYSGDASAWRAGRTPASVALTNASPGWARALAAP